MPDGSAVHGFSGCGNSTIAQTLVQALGAVRVRSDVERKRVGSIPSVEPTVVGGATRRYDDATTAATYARLAEVAEILLAHRLPTTPAVIARNLGRTGESQQILRLDELAGVKADMLSLILIGSVLILRGRNRGKLQKERQRGKQKN